MPWSRIVFIKVKNFNASKSKLGYAYLLTSKGVGEKTALAYRFLLRKIHEYEDIKEEIEVLKLDLRLSDMAKDDAE